jgi:5'-3' exonuclease
LGIWQTKYGPEDSIIISIDKDLDQIPGLKYNWVKDVGYNITPEQGYYNLCMQIMSGDSTDNIPGLPGIGPGKAAKALHGMEDPYSQMREVQNMYAMHSGKEDWEEYLLEQGRLVFIRREPDQMWEPPALPTIEMPTELTMELD